MIIFADGLCEPKNPGGCGCWGWVAVRPDGSEAATGYGAIGADKDMTNNKAEYTAVWKALRWAIDNGIRGFILRTDSQLVQKQVCGEHACHKPLLADLCEQVRQLLRETGGKIEWIPREANARADALAREAYEEWRRTRRAPTQRICAAQGVM